MAKNFQYYMEKVTEVYFEEEGTLEKLINRLQEQNATPTTGHRIIIDIINQFKDTKDHLSFISNLKSMKIKDIDKKIELKKAIENVIEKAEIDYKLLS
jgi:intein/homing endonuclease